MSLDDQSSPTEIQEVNNVKAIKSSLEKERSSLDYFRENTRWLILGLSLSILPSCVGQEKETTISIQCSKALEENPDLIQSCGKLQLLKLIVDKECSIKEQKSKKIKGFIEDINFGIKLKCTPSSPDQQKESPLYEDDNIEIFPKLEDLEFQEKPSSFPSKLG